MKYIASSSSQTPFRKLNDRLYNWHTCDIPKCRQSFGSKGELHRHKQTKHNQLPAHKLLRCPESGCRYSLTLHFKRKDNLTEHLKRIHNYAQGDAKAKADSQAKSQARAHRGSNSGSQSTVESSSQPPTQLVSAPSSQFSPTTATTSQPPKNLSIAKPSKRRRIDNSSPSSEDPSIATQIPNHAISSDDAETWKKRALESEAKTETLRLENENLKKEVERFKRNEDRFIGILEGRRG